MTANDLDLIDFLSAHPTYTLAEAEAEMGHRYPGVVAIRDDDSRPVEPRNAGRRRNDRNRPRPSRPPRR
jgi:hypothetical protein